MQVCSVLITRVHAVTQVCVQRAHSQSPACRPCDAVQRAPRTVNAGVPGVQCSTLHSPRCLLSHYITEHHTHRICTVTRSLA